MNGILPYLAVILVVSLFWFLLWEFVPAWRNFRVRVAVYVVLFGTWIGSLILRMLIR